MGKRILAYAERMQVNNSVREKSVDGILNARSKIQDARDKQNIRTNFKFETLKIRIWFFFVSCTLCLVSYTRDGKKPNIALICSHEDISGVARRLPNMDGKRSGCNRGASDTFNSGGRRVGDTGAISRSLLRRRSADHRQASVCGSFAIG